jgi:DnaJ-class molecular chaperone
MAKNYYLILGLKKEASGEEIRSAYRRLVKNYHPDRYGTDSAPFLLIQEAYEVLGDPERKREYDEILGTRQRTREVFRDVTTESLTRRHVEPLAQETYDRPFDASPASSFDTLMPTFNELFDYLWSNFARLDLPAPGKERPLTVEIQLSTFQARSGGQARITIPVNVICPACKGEGNIGYWECSHCAGEGRIAGEIPVIIDYPADLEDGHRIMIPIDRLGIGSTFLTVIFRIV